MKVAKAACSYFGLVFGAGFALGLVRVPVLVPRIGERWAELIEMPVMLLVIWWAARFVLRIFGPMQRKPHLWFTGLLALALLLLAEVLVVVLLGQQSIADYIRDRDPVSGTVYLLMLVVFAAMPYLLGRKPLTG